jgi:hypothetical protein|tara:strand:+ start:553 stop:816 length:264 start_codon:yes stop_codon:yes gene_type:complete
MTTNYSTNWVEKMARYNQSNKDVDLSRARIDAHNAFDIFWQFGDMTRSQAYGWLASKMSLAKVDCHIGEFDKRECAWVIEICEGEMG